MSLLVITKNCPMYAKVFEQIFDSSIADDYRLRHFFMDMLVLADQDGVVDMTPTAIAARTRIPLEDTLVFLQRLESEDPQSRSPYASGKRIEKLDEHRSWGWLIVNYERFRNLASEQQRRTTTRERVARYRLRQKELELGNASVTHSNAAVTQPYAYAYASEAASEGECEGKEIRDDQRKRYHEGARPILATLNESTGKGFREVDSNLTLISQRLRERGVTVEGVTQMVRRQCALWKGTDCEEYLRPETLFSKRKFDSYYGQRDQPITSPGGDSRRKGTSRNHGTFNTPASYNSAAIRKSSPVPPAE